MRTLKLHFPDDALPTLDTFVKQTKEARVFRRAQAVRHVVKGQRVGDRWEPLPCDDVAYGLGTAEDPSFFRLLYEGIEGGQGIIGKVPFEGPHAGRLRNQVRQKSAIPAEPASPVITG